jgi:cytochrome c peroxidase
MGRIADAKRRAAPLLLLLGAGLGCGTAGTPADQQVSSASAGETVPLDLGLMWPSFPGGLPPRAEEVALGKELFVEPLLSADKTIKCASCHVPEFGFADPRPVSLGVHGNKGRRNSMPLLNVAYFERLSWTGETASLEEQTLHAISNPQEMGVSLSELPGRIGPKYGGRLVALYGESSPVAVARALGAFQRSLVSGDSPFDRFVYGKEESAISESAKRGFRIFIGEARCVTCHSMRSAESHPFGGQTGVFADNRFHNLGIGYNQRGETNDPGRFEVTGNEADRGKFKTPTLRNVALTAPFMHDGSLKTLKDVIEHYDKGGNPNPNLDFDIQPLHLTAEEKGDLVSFLESLTSQRLLKGASRQATALSPGRPAKRGDRYLVSKSE